jgi:hypothetical protein
MVFYRSKSLIKPTMDMYAAAGTTASVCFISSFQLLLLQLALMA